MSEYISLPPAACSVGGSTPHLLRLPLHRSIPRGCPSMARAMRCHDTHIKLFLSSSTVRTIRRTVTTDAAKMLVNAFITSHVDYCNSVFVHSAVDHLRPLQSVLTAAAKLIMRKLKYDHITPAMKNELHWLPVPQRLKYQVCRFIYKCRHQMAPSYLVKMCSAVDSVESHRHL